MAKKETRSKKTICYIGMAKAVPVLVGREENYLLFNGFALLELEQLAGGKQYIEKMLEQSTDAIGFTADVLEILARQGELARRAVGLEPREMLKRDGLEFAITMPVRSACMDAIVVGTEREIPDDTDEIDLILVEQQKKR